MKELCYHINDNQKVTHGFMQQETTYCGKHVFKYLFYNILSRNAY